MVETADPTGDVPGVVDYERPDTWPQALIALFYAHAEILETHGREQDRINMLSSEEGQWVQNHYKNQHDRIVRSADEILADERLLGFSGPAVHLSPCCRASLRKCFSKYGPKFSAL